MLMGKTFPGEPVTFVDMEEASQYDYDSDPGIESIILAAEAWFGAAAVWIAWVHRGLMSANKCRLRMIDAAQLQDSVTKFSLEIIGLFSESLRVELHYELYAPILHVASSAIKCCGGVV